MLHIYHGTGKGKTTAAFGLALRELGHGRRVMIVQFLKNGSSGEMMALKDNPNVIQYVNSKESKFYFQMDREKQLAYAQTQLALWQHVLQEYKEYDVILLDELLDVISLNIIMEKDILSTLEMIANDVEVVITGRNPSSAIRTICDYNTEMLAQKHPFTQGVPARCGVEY